MVVIGLMGNGFITIASGLEWSRNKTLSSSDMILFVLSVSRLLFLGLTLGTFPSFIICLASSVFLIHSLLHHVKRMQQNREGFRDQRMDVQLRAVKMVTSFLLLYTVAFAAEISLMLFINPLSMRLWTTISPSYSKTPKGTSQS
ncbi:taste receptor type 2 member 40-like [Lacerta agilis]|uniref:taste receptor type 2 member 40-like n=1 Tax=Lacerta agilis TaxID=80427 RepID=UPI00141A5072|nr:taste receptor type 2 member 40-like [Lacerta agilis]